ncbi:MAG: hypothetical protein O3C40_34965 [Planctomycetota bacterium]|nr:hypothetical protein [Planctomycetota bacterium]
MRTYLNALRGRVDHLISDFASHIRQSRRQAAVVEGEPFVTEAEEVQERRLTWAGFSAGAQPISSVVP